MEELKAFVDACDPKSSGLPKGVKATAENYIRYAEMALDIIRKFPPDMQIGAGSLMSISLEPEQFRTLFAGKQVNFKRGNCIIEMWTYYQHIRIECMDYATPTKEKESHVITLE
jgi:hypothetical protein